ncbi:beta-galactosidase trimerization domain-containing protein [Bifidobacterium pseudolongum]|uniref:beta-galactosidase n=1 Tax=Bifidobacterium pseudolongum TaxID=1694 RepID=UPI0023F293FE|nr:beta-galactosidase trimerization domain-containing protein [Bifidobacterium pseudolongum]MCH4843327.1 beta-galactosidase trimerization domain-containing protein [Bifidobacterium pseudolongum]
MHYPDEVHRFYRPFWRRNVPGDMVESTVDLATLKQYRAVVAPTLIMVKPGVAQTLTQYVREGGYPGPLRELCGVWVEEIDAIAPDAHIDVTIGGRTVHGSIVASVIEPEGAQTIATYGGDFYAGTPAATVHTVGEGRVVFIGTALDAEGMSAVIDPVIDACGAETVDSPEGVEVMRRTADDGTLFTTVINTAGRPVHWRHALGGEDLDLSPFETRIM